MRPPRAKIAIVVPVYNRAEIVRGTLESLERQTLRPLHIVLVDNGSTDATAETLDRWAERVRKEDFIVDTLQCTTPGAAAARNAGLAAVTEPWTMFFDSDDIMPARHAENVASNTDDADLVGWDVEETDGNRRKTLRFVGRGEEQYDNLFHGGMATQRWAARTDLFRKAGGWNETVRYWDDIELRARILAENPRIVELGQSGIKVIAHDDSITGRAYGKPELAQHALHLIRETLAKSSGEKRAKLWCDVKLAIECGITDRNGARTGKELLCGISDLSKSAKWAYRYTRAGLPGAARILKAMHLHKNSKIFGKYNLSKGEISSVVFYGQISSRNLLCYILFISDIGATQFSKKFMV